MPEYSAKEHFERTTAAAAMSEETSDMTELMSGQQDYMQSFTVGARAPRTYLRQSIMKLKMRRQTRGAQNSGDSKGGGKDSRKSVSSLQLEPMTSKKSKSRHGSDNSKDSLESKKGQPDLVNKNPVAASVTEVTPKRRNGVVSKRFAVRPTKHGVDLVAASSDHSVDKKLSNGMLPVASVNVPNGTLPAVNHSDTLPTVVPPSYTDIVSTSDKKRNGVGLVRNHSTPAL